MQRYESDQGPTPREYAERALHEAEAVLRDAVTIAFPEVPGWEPHEAFPAPATVRAESLSDPLPTLDDERRLKLAEAASRLGFGSSESVTISKQGFHNPIVIIEGGQPHKIEAEKRLLTGDAATQPAAIIFSASPHRKVTSVDERASAAKLGVTLGSDATEYDVAERIARSMEGIELHDEPIVWDAGYDIDNNFAVSGQPTEQFVEIGRLNGAPVVMMQINRHDVAGGKYVNQPANADVIAIVDAVLRARHDASSPIVQITSGTYRPSRVLGVALAGLGAGRPVGLATYGSELVNQVRGTPGAPAPLDQLPGELHVMAEYAVKLREALARNTAPAEAVITERRWTAVLRAARGLVARLTERWQ